MNFHSDLEYFTDFFMLFLICFECFTDFFNIRGIISVACKLDCFLLEPLNGLAVGPPEGGRVNLQAGHFYITVGRKLKS